MSVHGIAAAPPYIPQITAPKASGGTDIDGDSDGSTPGEVENSAPAQARASFYVGTKVNTTA